MSKITNRELEALTAADGGRILREDGGIVGRVCAGTRGLTVSFRYEYKPGGSKRNHALGSWPKKRQPWRGLLIDGNPADLISEDSIMPPGYEEERTRILYPEEIKELHNIFAKMTASYEAAAVGIKYQHERPLKVESQFAI